MGKKPLKGTVVKTNEPSEYAIDVFQRKMVRIVNRILEERRLALMQEVKEKMIKIHQFDAGIKELEELYEKGDFPYELLEENPANREIFGDNDVTNEPENRDIEITQDMREKLLDDFKKKRQEIYDETYRLYEKANTKLTDEEYLVEYNKINSNWSAYLTASEINELLHTTVKRIDYIRNGDEYTLKITRK